MKNATRFLFQCVCAVAVLFIGTHVLDAFLPAVAGVSTAMAFGTRFKAATRAQLRAKATPLSGAAPEAIWWQFYDTQAYASGTARLTFFLNTNNDPTLSNMQSAGQFPDPQWLTIYDVTLDILNRPTRVAAADATGTLDDVQQLLKSGRGIWTLSISDKRYGPFSLTLLHGTGGGVGTAFIDAAAAPTTISDANNTLAPGWTYAGSLIIPPKTNFSVELQWIAAGVTLATSPTQLRVSLHGILSRRVL